MRTSVGFVRPRRRLSRILGATVALLLVAAVSPPSSAGASVQYFADPGAFLAAANVVSTETYEEIPPPGPWDSSQRTVVVDMVRYRSLDTQPPGFRVVSSGWPPPASAALTRWFGGWQNTYELELGLVNNGSTRALGFRLVMTTRPNQFVVTAQLIDGSSHVIELEPDVNFQYVGLAAPTGITRVLIHQRGSSESNFAIDDVSRGPVVPGCGQVLLRDPFAAATQGRWAFHNRAGTVRDGHLVIDGDYIGTPIRRDGWAMTHVGDARWRDYTYDVLVDTTNGGGSPAEVHMATVYARVQNADGTYYRIDVWDPGQPDPDGSGGILADGRVHLMRVVDGVYTTITVAERSNSTTGPNRVRVGVHGSRITVKVNGALIISPVDPKPLTFGGVGVGQIWETNGVFDDVLVRTPACA